MMAGIRSKPRLWATYLQYYPHLNVEVVERFNSTYNCIAWSIGINDRWVWEEIDLNENGVSAFSEFVQFYRKHGYELTNLENEADVALYGQKVGSGILVKHAAKRDPNGRHWQSKMGQGAVLRHRDLSAFKDSPYGTPVALFRRI
jgi:hypothetical protein